MHLLHIFVDELTELIYRKRRDKHKQRYHSNGVQETANNGSNEQDACYGADYEVIHIYNIVKASEADASDTGAFSLSKDSPCCRSPSPTGEVRRGPLPVLHQGSAQLPFFRLFPCGERPLLPQPCEPLPQQP